tara:strand:- start:2188 stop:2922 length:735 start_codon:yes stop_codon:yes gene_type:complete
MQLRDLSDMTAVVTGASSGIGAAAARALIAEGMNVVLSARSVDKLNGLAEELGERASVMVADVADRGQVARLFSFAKERHGGVDLLFNNAGVGYAGPFAESDPADWQRTFEANVFGVFNCTQEAIPLLRGRSGTMISSVASVAGRRGVEDLAVYSASKFAVVGFHDALRKELGNEGIRVSLIEPGAVYTNWGHGFAEGELKQRRDELQALSAEDIARLLVFGFAQPANVNLQEICVMPTRQLQP